MCSLETKPYRLMFLPELTAISSVEMTVPEEYWLGVDAKLKRGPGVLNFTLVTGFIADLGRIVNGDLSELRATQNSVRLLI